MLLSDDEWASDSDGKKKVIEPHGNLYIDCVN
jgi:hypothetical protein